MALSACSGTPSPSSSLGGSTEGSGVIKVWTPNDVYLSKNLVAKFEKENPQYQVELTEYGWDALHDKLVAAFSTGDVPDINIMTDVSVGEFAALGVLEPMDEFKQLYNVQDKDFIPGVWDYLKYTDEVGYAAPAYWEGRGLYYRSDLFEAAGVKPPTTLDELIEVGKKLSDPPNHYALANQEGQLDSHFFTWLLYTNGGDFFTEDLSKCSLTSDKAITALEYYKKLYDENIIPKNVVDRADTWAGFQNGFYAMAESGPWWVALINQDPTLQGKWDIAPLPLGSESKLYGHPNPWEIPKDAANKQGAYAFLNFMLQPENQVQLAKDAGLMATNLAAYDDPTFESNKAYEVLQLSNATSWNAIHNVPHGAEITTAVYDMESVVKNGGDPTEAATQACQTIDPLLADR